MAHAKPMRKMSSGGSGLVGGMSLSKTGVGRYDFRDPYHLALTVGWPAFIVAILAWFALINLVFAGLYLAHASSVAGLAPGSFEDAFLYSVETLGTVGTGKLYPADHYAHWVGAGEIVVGIAFTTIITGLIFVRFSRPKARILYADVAVITRHNGCPTLMMRIGNGRMNLLTDTVVRLTALINETSQEGLNMRCLYDLELTRSHYAVFALTLTLMHTIDARSPLHGRTVGELDEDDVRFFLSVEARDPALGAVVTDMHNFTTEHLRAGQRYADAVRVSGRGQAEGDLTLISLTEQDPTWPPGDVRLVCE